MWPFKAKQTETRASGGYSDTLVNAILERAGQRPVAVPGATAGLEAAAGLISRAFASASVAGNSVTRELFHPHLMAIVGRALIRQGEFVAILRNMGHKLMLLPAASHDVTGKPGNWQYQITVAAPGGSVTYQASAEAVLHVRANADPTEPWRGRSPIEIASLSGRLSAEIAQALVDESSGPRGNLLPVPADGSDNSLVDLRTQIGELRGKVALLQGGDWDTGHTDGRARWEALRLGANPGQALVQLYRIAFEDVVAACGLSSDLFVGGEGTGQREAYRRALHGTIQPYGRLLEAEAKRVLEDQTFKLGWEELGAADISGRARAFQSMVGSGMDTDKAAALSGLMSDD